MRRLLIFLPLSTKGYLDGATCRQVDRYKRYKTNFTDHAYLLRRYGVEVKEVVEIKDLASKMPDLTLPVSAGHGASYTYLIVNQPHMVVPVINAFASKLFTVVGLTY